MLACVRGGLTAWVCRVDGEGNVYRADDAEHADHAAEQKCAYQLELAGSVHSEVPEEWHGETDEHEVRDDIYDAHDCEHQLLVC